VRAEQCGRDAILYFELEPECSGFNARAEDDGRTIVLDLQRAAAAALASGTRAPVLRDLVNASAAADSFDVVVLDAGHGGFDHGAQGNGSVEKDLTLQWAQALQPVLERELGVSVVLVRDGDATLSPESRAELANRSQGDAFISLHCDAWQDPAARGVTVGYVPPERSAAADAALASIRRGVMDFLPWQTAYLPYAARSQRLADMLAAELPQQLGMPGRGAHPAPLQLLRGVAMPAVLIEAGFLTNGDDAKALADSEFITRMGAALVAALRRFRDESRGAAGAPPGGDGR
jgi:N-acetylmuramoyl-L-alanine amidase